MHDHRILGFVTKPVYLKLFFFFLSFFTSVYLKGLGHAILGNFVYYEL